MKKLNNMYKFTETEADVSDSKVYKTLELAENGNIKEFKKCYRELCKSSFGADNLKRGYYRLMGYVFDFTPFLKRFLVRYKYDDVYYVFYAINKTNIFDNFYITRSRITDVIEDVRYNNKLIEEVK